MVTWIAQQISNARTKVFISGYPSSLSMRHPWRDVSREPVSSAESALTPQITLRPLSYLLPTFGPTATNGSWRFVTDAETYPSCWPPRLHWLLRPHLDRHSWTSPFLFPMDVGSPGLSPRRPSSRYFEENRKNIKNMLSHHLSLPGLPQTWAGTDRVEDGEEIDEGASSQYHLDRRNGSTLIRQFQHANISLSYVLFELLSL